MLLIFFIKAVKYGAADLFLPARLRWLLKHGRVCTSEEVFVLLSGEIIACVLKNGLLIISADYAKDLVAGMLVIACAGENAWTVPACR